MPHRIQENSDAPARGWRTKFRDSWGISLGLLLILGVIAVYALGARPRILSSGVFPRSPSEFLPLRQLEEGLSQARSRLNGNPGDVKALVETGMLEFQRGEQGYISAIRSFEKARELGALDPRMFYYLGVMYQAEGLYDYAAREYLRFLNNRPGDFEARMLLAKLYYRAGRFPEAISEYELLLDKNPRDVTVLENLALSQWKKGVPCDSTLEKMRKLGAGPAQRAAYCQGKIAFESGKYSQAVEYLQGITAEGSVADPSVDAADARRMLARSYTSLKLTDFAVAAWNRVLKLSPDDEEARTALSKLNRTLKSSRSSGRK